MKIVLTGPESSGKTTLAKQLALELNAVFVPEFARFYLNNLGRDYSPEDLTKIAAGQMLWEDQAEPFANPHFVCDTDLSVVHVWHLYKYGVAEKSIFENLQNRLPGIYLLCSPDFDWKPDPLRENPHDRDALFEIYRHLLLDLNVPFLVLTGKPERRLTKAIDFISRFG